MAWFRPLIFHALIGGALLLYGAPIHAQPATGDETALMRDFVTGSLAIEIPNGPWSARRYFAADHTYRDVGSDGEAHGTWALENGKICVTQAEPTGRPAKYCNTGAGKRAGEEWTDTDPVTDNTIFFTLKPGR